MASEVKIPTLGESITEATIGKWLKKAGDSVRQDEAIAELETDKVAVELTAPVSGVLSAVTVKEGETVQVGAVVATIEAGAGGAASTEALPEAAPAAAPPAAPSPEPAPPPAAAEAPQAQSAEPAYAPAVRRLLDDYRLDAASIPAHGKDGRLTKEDVLAAIESGVARLVPTGGPAGRPATAAPARQEERVKMTRLRQTIARRLKDAQNTAAMLTTFNDVDMSAVMDARARYKDMFEKKHGIKLGFMSFFVKACVLALRDVPAVNAAIEGDELVYRNFADIGVAVSAPQGLVVPILRNADQMSFADCEKTIAEFGRRARDGQLKLEDMQGGTFTISNGGIFGSLLSTPILNPPQSGILGMHRIEERPVVREGQIVVRPMMYLALSYDHRVVDGREAVTFLVRIKDAIEDPARLLLDM